MAATAFLERLVGKQQQTAVKKKSTIKYEKVFFSYLMKTKFVVVVAVGVVLWFNPSWQLSIMDLTFPS